MRGSGGMLFEGRVVLRLFLGLPLTLLLRLDVSKVKVQDLGVNHDFPGFNRQVCVVEPPVEEFGGHRLVVLSFKTRQYLFSVSGIAERKAKRSGS